MKDPNQMPLVAALDEFIEKDPAYFCIPGHRFEQGVPEALLARWGESLFRYDLTECEGLDDLHAPCGAIQEAEELAAELFGADETRFCVNGTTAALEAMILGVAGPGEEILVARNVHRSVLSGLILSGARPVWVMPETDDEWGIATEITPDAVRQAILKHPSAKALLLTSPTYYGTACDLETIAQICHENDLPLLVDAAHGTHFHFNDDLPACALTASADLVAMSLHKTTGAMTQCSMLHYRAQRVFAEWTDEETGQVIKTEEKKHLLDFAKVDQALRMTISSSPSYVLMASLDASRHQLALHGTEQTEEAVELACYLRKSLMEIPGITVYGGCDRASLAKQRIDITRVVFRAEGISGVVLKDRLFENGAIALEMADQKNVVAVVTAGNTSQDILRLTMAVWNELGTVKETIRNGASPVLLNLPEMKMSPREAFFAPKEEIPLSQAEGRKSGREIVPYPPGIPVVNPGEVLTKEVLGLLEYCIWQGIPLHGLGEDQTVSVIK